MSKSLYYVDTEMVFAAPCEVGVVTTDQADIAQECRACPELIRFMDAYVATNGMLAPEDGMAVMHARCVDANPATSVQLLTEEEAEALTASE